LLSNDMDREAEAHRVALLVGQRLPGPVPWALVQRVKESHARSGLLPRHFAVRDESFRS
jgi:hypothetical protein